jgi:hypothetical protein
VFNEQQLAPEQYSQEDVEYKEDSLSPYINCAKCEYYIGLNQCELVAGVVKPEAVCVLFEACCIEYEDSKEIAIEEYVKRSFSDKEEIPLDCGKTVQHILNETILEKYLTDNNIKDSFESLEQLSYSDQMNLYKEFIWAEDDLEDFFLSKSHSNLWHTFKLQVKNKVKNSGGLWPDKKNKQLLIAKASKKAE